MEVWIEILKRSSKKDLYNHSRINRDSYYAFKHLHSIYDDYNKGLIFIIRNELVDCLKANIINITSMYGTSLYLNSKDYSNKCIMYLLRYQPKILFTCYHSDNFFSLFKNQIKEYLQYDDYDFKTIGSKIVCHPSHEIEDIVRIIIKRYEENKIELTYDLIRHCISYGMVNVLQDLFLVNQK